MSRILKGSAQLATKFIGYSWGKTLSDKSMPKVRKRALSYNGKKRVVKKYIHRTGVKACILILGIFLGICKIIVDASRSTESFKWLAEVANTALLYMTFTVIGSILAGLAYLIVCAYIPSSRAYYTKHSRRTRVRSFKKQKS